jgi:hypothetical protein
METASTSEMSVNLYQTTRRYNPEDSHLHTQRRKNLESYMYETRRTRGSSKRIAAVAAVTYKLHRHEAAV